jgi:hypothetical protein
MIIAIFQLPLFRFAIDIVFAAAADYGASLAAFAADAATPRRFHFTLLPPTCPIISTPLPVFAAAIRHARLPDMPYAFADAAIAAAIYACPPLPILRRYC